MALETVVKPQTKTIVLINKELEKKTIAIRGISAFTNHLQNIFFIILRQTCK